MNGLLTVDSILINRLGDSYYYYLIEIIKYINWNFKISKRYFILIYIHFWYESILIITPFLNYWIIIINCK